MPRLTYIFIFSTLVAECVANMQRTRVPVSKLAGVQPDDAFLKRYTQIFARMAAICDEQSNNPKFRAYGDEQSNNPKFRAYGKADEAVLVLDLDKTAIFGDDGNDLGMALQLSGKPQKVVSDLYRKIVSPCLLPAFEAMQQRAKKVHVVLYTRRSQVLKYKSCLRACELDVVYKDDWHYNGQVCFPSHIQGSSEILQCYNGPELLPDEALDVQMGIERLLAARDAITQELGLEAPPHVVVTATSKDVDSTVRALGLPDRNAYLFDDNRELLNHSKVVVTDALEALPLEQSEKVVAVMEQLLPVRNLTEDVIDFLLGAKPSHQAIEYDPETQQMRWRCPVLQQPLRPWRLPEIAADRSDASTKANLAATPRFGSSPASSPHRGAFDICAAVREAMELRRATGLLA